MIKKISLSLITFASLSTQTLTATDLHPVFQMGYDFGGKTLATVEHYDYYTGYEINKVRAGQGLVFEGGASISSEASNLELKLLVGYKFDRESTSNGAVTWDRVPLSAIAMVKKHKWKLGAGLTYHINPELSGSFSGYDAQGNYFEDKVDDLYEDSVGAVIEAQYNFSESSAIGIRGTLMEYKLKEDPSVVANGNSIGLNFIYTFGKETAFR